MVALVEIPAYYLAFRSMDVYGRRPVFVACHAVVFAACLSYLMLPGSGFAAVSLRTGSWVRDGRAV